MLMEKCRMKNFKIRKFEQKIAKKGSEKCGGRQRFYFSEIFSINIHTTKTN